MHAWSSSYGKVVFRFPFLGTGMVVAFSFQKKRMHLILLFPAFFKHTELLICIFLLSSVYTFPVLGTGPQLPFLFLRTGNEICVLHSQQRGTHLVLSITRILRIQNVFRFLENTNLRTDLLSKALNNLLKFLKFIRRNPDAIMKIADIAEVVYELIV